MSRTNYLSTILTLAGKDWRLFWADRRAAVLCFLVPIALASAFGMIFHRPAADSTTSNVCLPVLIVVEDDGPFTAQVAVDLLNSTRLEAKTATRSDAMSAVTNHRPGIAIVLPQGFERLKNWQPGQTDRPTIQILHNPSTGAERQLAEGVVSETVMRRMAREKLGGLLNGKDESALASPFRVDAASVTSGVDASFNAYSHSFCGMTLQYLLFWGMESGLLLLRERQRGVWCRMRAAPISLGCVLSAKALATALIALLQVLVTFGFGYLVFGVSVTGSMVGFILLALASCGLAAATGLLVAAIGGTEARARSVSILVILGVSMIGGLWMPAFLLPAWIREASLTLPTSWAMRGLGAVTWQGLGFWPVLPCVLAVTAFAGVFLTVAIVCLKRSEWRSRVGIQ
ncbi:MAG TPA: ABC transporter permease [Gemmata sp.]|jgi:ABC-2 type transport system permease protein|nr:ABC transporter permease [Gemmata sp.]